MQVGIHDRGRGPEIIGTRITVYTILDYLELGYHHTLIALELNLCSAQVLEAIRYIEEHRTEVMAEYQRILERSRNARNSPEVESARRRGHVKLVALRKQLRQARAEREAADARHPPGQ
jgi:uncharacterized protein (DUF433 family)